MYLIHQTQSGNILLGGVVAYSGEIKSYFCNRASLGSQGWQIYIFIYTILTSSLLVGYVLPISLVFCILLCLFSFCVLCSMFPVPRDCPYLIPPSGFSNIYKSKIYIRRLWSKRLIHCSFWKKPCTAPYISFIYPYKSAD